MKNLLADTAALPPGRKHLIVGTAAVSVGEDCSNKSIPQTPAGAAVIANMAVDQRHRKQGIARMLLRACELHALKMELDCISLIVHKKNTPARELYQSSGFREIPLAKPAGMQSFLSFGSNRQHIVMVKDVEGKTSM